MVMLQNIRIFNSCDVLIENSITKVTVQHHEAREVSEFSIPTEQPL